MRHISLITIVLKIGSNVERTRVVDNGIIHEITASYTPHHNGVAERRNRTIMNMVRSMIKGTNLPLSFWVEATEPATYILNRCPTQNSVSLVP